MRVRRVGSITCGLSFITFGILFIMHSFFQIISLQMIFKFWPLILISMGIELIISNIREKGFEDSTYIYDKGAVVLLLLLAFFAVCMGCVELLMQYARIYATF